tara:strand:- start:559 stop:1269 length:711 start_codon:yes stop_codon:yes gene_type:complete
MTNGLMKKLDLTQLDLRNFNSKLKNFAKDGVSVSVLHPQAKHNLAVGILNQCQISIEGSVGYYCCSFSDGPNFIINGNSGWGLGSNLMNGSIVVKKNAGASVACSMRNGQVCVYGNAGARAGIAMKGGQLIIGGNSGYLTGYMMQKGKIIICGDVGDAVADSMYEGIIYVGGKISSLGNDAEIGKITTKEIDYIKTTLQNYNINKNTDWKKIISSKKLYNYDALEPLEKTKLGKTI